MRDGLIKVAAGTPSIRVADCRYNAEQIFTLMREAQQQGVKVLCLPELCLTGYTCGDLFLQNTLLNGAEEGLETILEATINLELVAAVGLPVRCSWNQKLYNCAAVIQKGKILGLIPKIYLPNYNEFYEARWFTSGEGVDCTITLCGQQVPLSDQLTFWCETMPDLVLGVEICEDLWTANPPSVRLAQSGATVICRAVCPVAVWLFVCQCWRGRVYHRCGFFWSQSDSRKWFPVGRTPVCHWIDYE